MFHGKAVSMRNIRRIALAAIALLGASCGVQAQSAVWDTFNGDLKAQKFSPLTQITPENVGNLKMAWRTHTGDVSAGGRPPIGIHMRADESGRTPTDLPPTVWSATPIFVNDTLYLGTPFYRIFALEPGTGKVKWTYDTHAVLEALTQPDLKNRGVAYWQADTPTPGEACQKRVYIGTMDAKLHSVDADTGKPCADFGANGVLDINQWNTENAKWPLSLLQPPTVYKDTLFLGWAGRDWEEQVNPPGTIFAIEARTGALKWTFEAIPKEEQARSGTSNVWASMSVDPDTGVLYVPISSPSPDYYGGERKEGSIPLATSVTALDSQTGKVLWSRQLVHHDIWDYDTNSAPVLVDIQKDGRTIPALVQSTKQGFLFVLDRKTGEPIYPIEERKVPASDVPGEEAAATQPQVPLPEPTIPDRFPGISSLADAVSLGWCSRKLSGLRYEGRFTPPSLKGTLAYPPTTGGVEWGGGAVDPASGTYVVNSSSVAQIYTLVPRDQYQAQVNNGERAGLYAMAGAPYAFRLETFLNPFGMPCWKPPYGTMSAYDLKTGKLLWRKPFGVVQKWGFYMPAAWGSVTIGAPVVTASGLVFIGASMDSRVRAIDLKSGDVLWQAQVDAPAVAMPATYTWNGRQYVVFVAGGNAILTPRVGDQVVAFALPQAPQ